MFTNSEQSLLHYIICNFFSPIQRYVKTFCEVTMNLVSCFSLGFREAAILLGYSIYQIWKTLSSSTLQILIV